MYSVVCRKVHDSRFTLGQLQRSIQRARDRLDYERIELAPELMDKLLMERQENDHKGNSRLHIDEPIARFSSVPFTPSQPTQTMQAGEMYLTSIDQSYRRFYEKYAGSENDSTTKPADIQKLYVSDTPWSLLHSWQVCCIF